MDSVQMSLLKGLDVLMIRGDWRKVRVSLQRRDSFEEERWFGRCPTNPVSLELDKNHNNLGISSCVITPGPYETPTLN